MTFSCPRIVAAILPLLAATVLVMSGCGSGDLRARATGREGEIMIVIDSTRWNGPIGEALKETVGQYIRTLPTPERQFDLRPVALKSDRDLEQARRQKNVIFVAPLSDTTNEATYLRNVFDDQAQAAIRTGEGAVVGRADLWRRSQRVFFVTGATVEAVVDILQRRSEDISRTFNEVTRSRMALDMFDRGRQEDLEQQLMEKHGFAVNVQHDYQIAIDTTNFVWLRRVLSDTWRSLFVYYEDRADPGMLTPEWVQATRDSLSRLYLQGNSGGWVEIDERRPISSVDSDFLGRFGFEVRGLWHMVGVSDDQEVQFGMGGPFLTYAFYDQATGRIYVIDGMVFAPNFNKRDFLRQMEVIAHTFRTERDERRQEEIAER